MTWPIIACITAAILYGLGAVLQSAAARRASPNQALATIIRQGPYMAGLVCDLFGWLLAIYAVNHLPLFAVHTTLASSVVVTAVLASLLWHTPLRRADTVAIGAIFLGVILVGLAAAPVPDTNGGTKARVALALGVPVAGMLGLLAARLSLPIAAASIAGLLFSLGATTVRTFDLETTPGKLLLQPTSWTFAAYMIAGLVVHAHSLRTGNVGPVTAALWATEILVAATAGYLLFGDRTRPGAQPGALIGVLLTLGATIKLALGPSLSARPGMNERPKVTRKSS